jgi:hypothetical protein
MNNIPSLLLQWGGYLNWGTISTSRSHLKDLELFIKCLGLTMAQSSPVAGMNPMALWFTSKEPQIAEPNGNSDT